jgi:hypothetical protein
MMRLLVINVKIFSDTDIIPYVVAVQASDPFFADKFTVGKQTVYGFISGKPYIPVHKFQAFPGCGTCPVCQAWKSAVGMRLSDTRLPMLIH